MRAARATSLIWALLDQGFLSLANFGTSFAVARFASADDYGLYVLSSTMILLALTVLQVSLVMTPLIFLAPKQGDGEARAYIQATAAFHLTLSGLSVIAFGTAGTFLVAVGVPAYGYASWIAAAVIALTNARYFVRNFHIMRGRFQAAATNDGIVLACLIVVGSALIALHRLSIANIAVMLVVSEAGALAWAYLRYRSHVHALVRAVRREGRVIVRRGARANWAFGRWLLYSGIANFFVMRAQFMLLPGFVDLRGVARYHASFLLLQPVFVLTTGVEGYAWNRAVGQYRAGGWSTLERFLKRLATPLSLLVAAYTAVIAWFAPAVVAALFAAKFEALGAAIWLFGAAALLSLWAKMLSTGLMIAERTHGLFWTNVVGSAVTIAGTLALLPLIGVTGAAAGYAAGTCALVAAQAWYWRVLRSERGPDSAVASSARL